MAGQLARPIIAFTTDALSIYHGANRRGPKNEGGPHGRRREEKMDFGYFTLSDNHYENNKRSSNQFVADITAEALYAEKLGMHSAWIGEHHFNSLGVLSCPDLVLAYVAANTKRIRLAPAVTVLPLHHPDSRGRAMGDARPLVRRTRRFCLRSRLRQARISALPRLVRGKPGDLRRGPRGGAPAVGGGRPYLPPRQVLFVRRRAHHAEAGPAPDTDLCRIVLQAFDRARRTAGLRTYRRAVCRRDELWRPQAGRRSLS